MNYSPVFQFFSNVWAAWASDPQHKKSFAELSMAEQDLLPGKSFSSLMTPQGAAAVSQLSQDMSWAGIAPSSAGSKQANPSAQAPTSQVSSAAVAQSGSNPASLGGILPGLGTKTLASDVLASTTPSASSAPPALNTAWSVASLAQKVEVASAKPTAASAAGDVALGGVKSYTWAAKQPMMASLLNLHR